MNCDLYGPLDAELTNFTNPTMHLTNIPQYTTLEQKCTHFCSNVVHCGIWGRCTVGFVRLVYCMDEVCIWGNAKVKISLPTDSKSSNSFIIVHDIVCNFHNCYFCCHIFMTSCCQFYYGTKHTLIPLIKHNKVMFVRQPSVPVIAKESAATFYL